MKTLQIAVGIIRNPQDEIFVTRRAADVHMANRLEFPGGKIEPLETPEQALARELREEVGITPLEISLFEKLEYQFPDRHLTLWFWLVERWEGEPWGREGQPGQWIAQRALDAEAFPPANKPVINRLMAGQSATG
ncbi:8-oxo-dGTP diphosphatase MutT [Intestinirhabdus alba]|jgi:8-oxo-dGTP diphosphatase|uniref:8-oxo-dGTP diphosphatase n=1 Tax=Intestinirhabdus alba TaxID=2899544 RepID=A0A6L6IJ73_9ENTR|nr:8-oxo-dGTP diphosphatase MutT [Intestinirhabdus alba]MTH45120.1 8-oxo-dGTP diphosphatase MutT [Intestinirhabdus alba]